MISVIIRSKNEERWIKPCLERVLSQQVRHQVEILLVDNHSTDKTIEKARQVCPDLRLVTIEHFLPGYALNEGIRASQGEYIVCLSAHCPPINDQWLEGLLSNFDEPNVAGVYGRQVPTRFTNPVDKRDLLLTFGMERRVQKKETFFHNANSMLRKDVWDAFPFDEEISNIEDRLWGKEVIKAGYTIVYEPEAAVFHYHGIHQDNNISRARNVVQVLENHLSEMHPDQLGSPFDPESLEIAAFIPLKGTANSIDFCESLVNKTMEALLKSKFISQIFIATDSEKIAKMTENMGAKVPFLRSSADSAPGVRADEVLKHFFKKMEKSGYYPDLVVPVEITYPFRPPNLIDGVIKHLVHGGYDTVVAGIPEYRTCWQSNEVGFSALTDTSVPRSARKPLYISIPSLACVTYPCFLRQGTRYGENVGVFEVNDSLAGIEIRTKDDFTAIEHRLKF